MADVTAAATADVLAFTAFPPEHWRKVWSNNQLEGEHVPHKWRFGDCCGAGDDGRSSDVLARSEAVGFRRA